MCTRIIILILSVQLLSAEDGNCKNGAKCIIVEHCEDIYNTLKLFERTYLLKLLQGLHCGYDGNNESKTRVRQPSSSHSSSLAHESTTFRLTNLYPKAHARWRYSHDNIEICCPPNFGVPHQSTNSGELSNNEALSLLPSKELCGLYIEDKIAGGEVTNLDEHPWMAIIYSITPTETKFSCGGVLISSRYVMTAAHCVRIFEKNTVTYKVRLGEWQISSKKDCLFDECSPDPINVDVEEVVPHEDHTLVSQHNDIALLRLARSIPYTEFVRPICLPLDTKLRENTFETYNLEIAGWGVSKDDLLSDIKLKVVIPLRSFQQCRLLYKKYNFTEKQICAGGLRGQDSCKGDSGGPLMGQIDSKNWMVIGIVSYGSFPCGRPGWPGVYTRVTSYIDWILSKIRP